MPTLEEDQSVVVMTNGLLNAVEHHLVASVLQQSEAVIK